MVSVREIGRFLEQWQMDARDLHRRLILAPTLRERERWHAIWLLPKDGGLRVWHRPWDGIHTPSEDGSPPSARGAAALILEQSDGFPPLSERRSSRSWGKL